MNSQIGSSREDRRTGRRTLHYTCENLPPGPLGDAKVKGEAMRALQDQLVQRQSSNMVKATLRIKNVHVDDTSRYGKIHFTVSLDAAAELDLDPFLFYDFEKHPVQRLIQSFKQCSKCASFSHIKSECDVEGPLCIRCGGQHFDPSQDDAEPVRGTDQAHGSITSLSVYPARCVRMCKLER